MNTYVVKLPRRAKPLFRGGLAACHRFISSHAAPGMPRLALVVSTPPPQHGSDAVVCVPAIAFGAWEVAAAAVVAGWELKWSVLTGLPPRYRDEARADLLHVVGSALIAAAIDGVDSAGLPDQLAF